VCEYIVCTRHAIRDSISYTVIIIWIVMLSMIVTMFIIIIV
jgi:hypothetical protein